MEMRSGARAAPVWGWRCFLRGYVAFYAKAAGIQEENQIGRGAAQNLGPDSVHFCQLPLALFWSIGLSKLGAELGCYALMWRRLRPIRLGRPDRPQHGKALARRAGPWHRLAACRADLFHSPLPLYSINQNQTQRAEYKGAGPDNRAGTIPSTRVVSVLT